MIPHGNPSFLIDKSSPKQIKTPGSPPGVFIWGQPSAAGVTPHCAGAASPRRSHSEPGSPSPLTASVKFSEAALFEACGPAMGGTAQQFLPGACPLPRSARQVPFHHAKRPRTRAVTHRYKKWTMGNRNGSKEARRYSPGLLYCYRFSITTPPALPESVKSLIFKYRTKREKDNNNLLAR